MVYQILQYEIRKWKAFMDLKKYFDALCGCNIYSVLPNVVLCYNILQDEFSFIIFGKGPYSPSAVFLRHPAFA